MSPGHPNPSRFDGFTEQYDDVRPTPPDELGSLLASYAGGRGRVIDLGSGSGLSTRWAARWAAEVIGVEPGAEMRRTAADRAPDLTFVEGWGHDTGLDASSADVVTCVQAFHWMDPTPTLAEVARVLRPGGVFAAIDCDWPPAVGDHVVERAWHECRATIRVLERRLAEGSELDVDPSSLRSSEEWTAHDGVDPHRDRVLAEGVRSWPKSEHLARLDGSGHFAWTREVVAHSTEPCDADRFVGLLRSQGDYRTLRRHGLDDEQLGVAELARTTRERLGDGARTWVCSWRARLGVRAADSVPTQ